MKKLISLITLLGISLCTLAETKTAIDNKRQGWSEADNWSPIGVPQNGDVVVIPEDITLTVKGTLYNGTQNLSISIRGTLQFDPSGKLDLGINTSIQLLTNIARIISSGNGGASQLISINGIIKYAGNTDGTITGPAFASSATGASGGTPPGFGGGISLPVSLTHFTALARQTTALLSWQTATEQNARHFEVERSADAAQWQKLATVAATGTNSTYTYTDLSPLATTNYYRLKMIDNDGNSAYSAIVKIGSAATASLQLGPNPATSFLNISLSQPTGPLALQVVSNSGQVIKQYTPATSATLRLDLSSLTKGQYFLVVKSDNQLVETRTFIIH